MRNSQTEAIAASVHFPSSFDYELSTALPKFVANRQKTNFAFLCAILCAPLRLNLNSQLTTNS